jgi:hypothetical protein
MALDEGLRSDSLTTTEREELNRLRRENRVLREEREILGKAAASFSGDRGDAVAAFAFVGANQAMHSNCDHVPRAGRLPQQLLRAAEAAALGARPGGWRA